MTPFQSGAVAPGKLRSVATTPARRSQGITLERFFTREGRHPFDEVRWGRRNVKLFGFDKRVVEFEGLEFPVSWSVNASNIAGSKYFRGRIGTPERETSVRQMVGRVAGTIRQWGERSGHFAEAKDAEVFEAELIHILLNQKAAFNSPVWFNVGVEEKPQCAACQPYRALVSTPGGFYPIGAIVDQNLVGLPVYDSNGITRVVAVKQNGTKPVYRVVLRNGTFVEATGDHLVKAAPERRTRSQWVRVDQLQTGMRLQLHPHREILDRFPESFSEVSSGNRESVAAEGGVITRAAFPTAVASRVAESEAALAGWLQADGFVGQYRTGTNRSLTIECIVMTDEEERWVTSHLDVVFPSAHRKVRVTKTAAGTPVTRIRLYGEHLRPFVEAYGLQRRREDIRVPAVLWQSSPAVITAYLRSVFQGEGFVMIQGRSVHLAVDTISREWMHDLQLLLYGLGIYSRIRRKNDTRDNRHALYELDISMGSERRKFAERIGFLSRGKQDRLRAALTLSGQKTIPDLREEEIVSIELGPTEPVYDIQTVSGEYLTNHVAVHNCFILKVDDTMSSILDWYHTEGVIFKGGSGTGVNLSPLRSNRETLSNGGFSSGPVSFMRGADAIAGSIAAGGSTRRAAKMVVLNVDHPDVVQFIRCKAEEEKKIRALMAAGYDMTDINNDGWKSIQYQMANNSVRVTDEFMRAVEEDGVWQTRFVKSGEVADEYRARDLMAMIAQAAWESGDPGLQYDTTINNWHTCPNTGPITASNPCSEYLHLDNSACNLASINLLKFLRPDGSFAVDDFRHTVRVMILAQELIVDGSSYPTPEIAQTAHDYRELGLGYANLGAFLMTKGLPYDSEEARAWAGAITALMCGEAYRHSAEIAAAMGPYEGYAKNREPQLNVIEKHRAAMDAVRAELIDDEDLVVAAQEAWDEALTLAREHGVRNSQVTVIAPTGTIALLMDCDTTGCEPDFALVKTKQLVGGGTMKIVNRSVPTALERLGYSDAEVRAIVEHTERTGTIEGAPGLKEEHLAIFDCAVKSASGTRAIFWQGHVRMVAAIQPFISGSISKTFNMSSEATPEEIMEAYLLGWKLGLKCFAVYRDGSKAAQPLTTSGTAGSQPQQLVLGVGPTRRRLPPTRGSETHKFSIAGHEGYLTYGMYEDGKLAEIFIMISKQGSTLSGLLHSFAITVSMALQYGVPLKDLARKFVYGRYEPAGVTENPEIRIATSITDYIFRYLALRFLSAEAQEELGMAKVNGNGNGAGVHTAAGPAASQQPVFGPRLAEMLPGAAPVAIASTLTYADTVCRICGGMMIQTGNCKTCLQCGEASGGCS